MTRDAGGPMHAIARFAAYAAAFEKAFENDDWSVVEPFFTEDAVYEVEGGGPFATHAEGRDAVMAAFKKSLDTFDRRVDVREPELLEGPTEREGAVWVRWAVTYRLEGAPDCVVGGEEWVWFEGDRIRRMEDHIPDEDGRRAEQFLRDHGTKLRPHPG